MLRSNGEGKEGNQESSILREENFRLKSAESILREENEKFKATLRASKNGGDTLLKEENERLKEMLRSSQTNGNEDFEGRLKAKSLEHEKLAQKTRILMDKYKQVQADKATEVAELEEKVRIMQGDSRSNGSSNNARNAQDEEDLKTTLEETRNELKLLKQSLAGGGGSLPHDPDYKRELASKSEMISKLESQLVEAVAAAKSNAITGNANDADQLVLRLEQELVKSRSTEMDFQSQLDHVNKGLLARNESVLRMEHELTRVVTARGTDLEEKEYLAKELKVTQNRVRVLENEQKTRMKELDSIAQEAMGSRNKLLDELRAKEQMLIDAHNVNQALETAFDSKKQERNKLRTELEVEKARVAELTMAAAKDGGISAATAVVGPDQSFELANLREALGRAVQIQAKLFQLEEESKETEIDLRIRLDRAERLAKTAQGKLEYVSKHVENIERVAAESELELRISLDRAERKSVVEVMNIAARLEMAETENIVLRNVSEHDRLSLACAHESLSDVESRLAASNQAQTELMELHRRDLQAAVFEASSSTLVEVQESASARLLEIEQLREARVKLQGAMDAQTTKLDHAENEMRMAQANCQALEEEMTFLRETVTKEQESSNSSATEANATIEKTKAKLDEIEKARVSAEARFVELEQNNVGFKVRCVELEQAKVGTEARCFELEIRLEAVSMQTDAFRQTCEALEKESGEIRNSEALSQEKLGTLVNTLRETERKRAGLKEALIEANTTIESLMAQHDKQLKSFQSQAGQSSSELETKLRDTNAERANANVKISELENRAAELQRDYDAKDRLFRETEERVANLREQLNVAVGESKSQAKLLEQLDFAANREQQLARDLKAEEDRMNELREFFNHQTTSEAETQARLREELDVVKKRDEARGLVLQEAEVLVVSLREQLVQAGDATEALAMREKAQGLALKEAEARAVSLREHLAHAGEAADALAKARDELDVGNKREEAQGMVLREAEALAVILREQLEHAGEAAEALAKARDELDVMTRRGEAQGFALRQAEARVVTLHEQVVQAEEAADVLAVREEAQRLASEEVEVRVVSLRDQLAHAGEAVEALAKARDELDDLNKREKAQDLVLQEVDAQARSLHEQLAQAGKAAEAQVLALQESEMRSSSLREQLAQVGEAAEALVNARDELEVVIKREEALGLALQQSDVLAESLREQLAQIGKAADALALRDEAQGSAVREADARILILREQLAQAEKAAETHVLALQESEARSFSLREQLAQAGEAGEALVKTRDELDAVSKRDAEVLAASLREQLAQARDAAGALSKCDEAHALDMREADALAMILREQLVRAGEVAKAQSLALQEADARALSLREHLAQAGEAAEALANARDELVAASKREEVLSVALQSAEALAVQAKGAAEALVKVHDDLAAASKCAEAQRLALQEAEALAVSLREQLAHLGEAAEASAKSREEFDAVVSRELVQSQALQHAETLAASLREVVETTTTMGRNLESALEEERQQQIKTTVDLEKERARFAKLERLMGEAKKKIQSLKSGGEADKARVEQLEQELETERKSKLGDLNVFEARLTQASNRVAELEAELQSTAEGGLTEMESLKQELVSVSAQSDSLKQELVFLAGAQADSLRQELALAQSSSNSAMEEIQANMKMGESKLQDALCILEGKYENAKQDAEAAHVGCSGFQRELKIAQADLSKQTNELESLKERARDALVRANDENKALSDAKQANDATVRDLEEQMRRAEAAKNDPQEILQKMEGELALAHEAKSAAEILLGEAKKSNSLMQSESLALRVELDAIRGLMGSADAAEARCDELARENEALREEMTHVKHDMRARKDRAEKMLAEHDTTIERLQKLAVANGGVDRVVMDANDVGATEEIRVENEELRLDLANRKREIDTLNGELGRIRKAFNETQASQRAIPPSPARLKSATMTEDPQSVYLKNVLISFMTSRDPHEQLGMVKPISQLAGFSSQEADKVRKSLEQADHGGVMGWVGSVWGGGSATTTAAAAPTAGGGNMSMRN